MDNKLLNIILTIEITFIKLSLVTNTMVAIHNVGQVGIMFLLIQEEIWIMDLISHLTL